MDAISPLIWCGKCNLDYYVGVIVQYIVDINCAV